MSSVRSFSTAVSAAATNEEGWTRVGSSHRGGWGTPTAPAPAPTPASRRTFSFASAATVSALEGGATMPPRAPSSRMPQAEPPRPKAAGSWGSSRPTGAISAAKEANKTPNIQSLSEFPTLGGSRASAAPAPAPALTWSRTVADMAARAEAEETAAAEAAAATRRRQETQRRSRLATIGARCFDDGPADEDDRPDEDDGDDAAGYYGEVATRPEDMDPDATATEAGEFNPTLVPTRRAGDKGDW